MSPAWHRRDARAVRPMERRRPGGPQAALVSAASSSAGRGFPTADSLPFQSLLRQRRHSQNKRSVARKGRSIVSIASSSAKGFPQLQNFAVIVDPTQVSHSLLRQRRHSRQPTASSVGGAGSSLNRFFISEGIPPCTRCEAEKAIAESLNRFFVNEGIPTCTRCEAEKAIAESLNRFFVSEGIPRSARHYAGLVSGRVSIASSSA